MRSKFRQPKKLVLFYNPMRGFFGKHLDFVFPKCRINCDFTRDRSLVQKADAVIVHVCRLRDRQPPNIPSSRQIWIAYGLESPSNFNNRYDAWKGVFNWTMTYRLDSDIFAPYSFLTLRQQPSGKNYTAIALAKTKPIAWFVSNCQTPSLREVYVKRLQQYIDVDIYGGCGNLKCSRSVENQCRKLLNTTYYFYLSFENSLCKDYATEKFFKTFDNVNVIPIVRGSFDYGKHFDGRTFINTADFNSPKQLATHLQGLIRDRTAYAKMLETKDMYLEDMVNKTSENAFCEVCERLYSPEIRKRTYPDYMAWYRDGMCRKPADL